MQENQKNALRMAFGINQRRNLNRNAIDYPTESAKNVFFFPIGLKKIRRIQMKSFCKPFFFAKKKSISGPKKRQLRIL